MPWSSSALRISAIASASLFSPHQPVATVHVPKPTSLTATPLVGRMRVFIASSFGSAAGSEALGAQTLRRFGGEIGDDHVRAGAPDADQRFHHRPVTVDPSTLGRSTNHSVLATHLIGGERIAGLRLHMRDD